VPFRTSYPCEETAPEKRNNILSQWHFLSKYSSIPILEYCRGYQAIDAVPKGKAYLNNLQRAYLEQLRVKF
jgi:hypothetical protein